ncbi:MAG: CBS domain-containing protein [Chitinophagales bacterium]|nr:CBS domain-containing protein [Chitinophagales bacterium]
MFANLLLDQLIPNVKIHQTVYDVLNVIHRDLLYVLPVVDSENKLVGIVKEAQLLDAYNENDFIENYIIPVIPVSFDEHIFNILKNKNLKDLSICPVIDMNGQYIGCISSQSIVYFLSQNKYIQEAGGIIVMEIKIIDYSLTELSRLVESNHANILQVFTSEANHPENMIVSLSIDKDDLKEVIATFERFEYQIMAVFQSANLENDYQERYESLMMYLNI